jgi:hypothetical protein
MDKKKFASKISSAAGWAVVAMAGMYANNLLILMLLMWGTWWISANLLSNEKKLIIPVLAVNAGHGLLFCISAALTGTLFVNSIDLLVYAIGLIWLVKKPSPGPLYFLGAYQTILLVINGINFAAMADGSVGYKILLATLIWRALALFFIIRLFITLRVKAIQTNVT